MAIITHLRPWINLLAWLTITGPKIAIIEDQGCQPCLCEDFGKTIEVHFLHCRETMSHDDGGKWPFPGIWYIQPSTQSGPFSIEGDVLTHVEHPFWRVKREQRAKIRRQNSLYNLYHKM